MSSSEDEDDMDDLDKGAGWGQAPATAIQNTTVTATGTTFTTGAQWCGRGMQVSAADERAAPAIEGEHGTNGHTE